MQSLKDLALMVFEKKPTLDFFQMKKYVYYLPWVCAIIKIGDIFIIYLMYLTILWTVNIIRWEHKIFN